MIKKLGKILLVLFFSVIYIYMLYIDKIPEKIIIYGSEEKFRKRIFGINYIEQREILETSATNSEKKNDKSNKIQYSMKLFNKIPLKKIEVETIEKTSVIPMGDLAGVKLYTNGVLVVGMSEIEGMDKKIYKPYERLDIKEGDTILKINNEEVINTSDLIKKVNLAGENRIKLKYLRKNQLKECSIQPIKIKEKEYKLGLWVRDSAAGVGTVTFYEPKSGIFGALGHGITDIDTGELINIASGEFVNTRVLNIEKGLPDIPGKIQGTIKNQKLIGKIEKNTNFGIFGKFNSLEKFNIDTSKSIEVVARNEIKRGEAEIICDLDGKGKKKYKIQIEKIYKENNYNNKSMKIRVTDEELLEKTGGIIQGMSGAPIIQNGKFIGAVTAVVVKNPMEGYAIFGDLMIKEARKVK